VITVLKAPPYLTVQDGGREHSRASGVPRGGAMDRFALETLNAIVGNPLDAAGLEWALGGGILRFDSPCIFACGGAGVSATLAEKPVRSFTALSARAGDELKIQEFNRGRFLYLAFSGGIDVPEVLGSRATYLPAHFGGLNGGMVARGNRLGVGSAPSFVPRVGFSPDPALIPQYDSRLMRVTRGTHADLFDDAKWREFTGSEFTIATASDRTGYKLSGPALSHTLGSLPSDPGCQGAIQVPADGSPIVLMADAPTVGGYPKIAVVSEADLPLVAQLNPGERLRFKEVSIEESQRALRQRASDLNLIRSTGAASA
jgi:antagonist of KipI